MNSFIVVMTMIAWVLFSNNQPRKSPAEKRLLFEKRAIAETRRTLASDLDSELPRLSFADWFERVVGPAAGVVWQLSECGAPTEIPPHATPDTRACVEANAILGDGRGVILRIVVGTFKKGITGAPEFYFGVIEQEGELLLVQRLRDLRKRLSEPRRPPDRPAIRLPEVSIGAISLAATNAYVADLPMWSGEDSSQLAPIEDPAPAEPPQRRGQSNTASNAEKQSVAEAVHQGAAIVKAQPVYPRSAKRFNASGPVEVRITVSADGRVTDAKAVSGHSMLHEAAVEAARKWIFKPTTVNGVPVETKLALTFVFPTPP